MKDKVRLFLIREGADQLELLVFKEPDFPEAGTQVPGGTVDPGEKLEEAIGREFYEETGFQVSMDSWELFSSEVLLHPQTRETQLENAFFRKSSLKEFPERFEHLVTGGGEDEGILFSYSWVGLEKAEVELIDWMSDQLKTLRKLKGF